MGKQFPKVMGPQGEQAQNFINAQMAYKPLNRYAAGNFTTNPSFISLSSTKNIAGVPIELSSQGRFLGDIKLAQYRRTANPKVSPEVIKTIVDPRDLEFTLLHELGHASHLGRVGTPAYGQVSNASREFLANKSATDFMKQQGMKLSPHYRNVVKNWDKRRAEILRIGKARGQKNVEAYVSSYDHFPKMAIDKGLMGLGIMSGVGAMGSMENMSKEVPV